MAFCRLVIFFALRIDCYLEISHIICSYMLLSVDVVLFASKIFFVHCLAIFFAAMIIIMLSVDF